MKKYRIVGIAQIHNELRKGNLKRFLKYFRPLVDELVLYDDASTDGSFEFAQKFTPHVIRGIHNEFGQEIAHKKLLLKEALKLKPDFILWLDADEIFTVNAAEELPKLCQKMAKNQIDGISFHELNLWRSMSWRRVDNAYDDGWFVRLWRVTPKIGYEKAKRGLHQYQHPSTLKKMAKTEKIQVIHYGFSSDDTILRKYLTYQSHGQTGWELQRLIDESILSLKAVDPSLFPPALRVRDRKPLPRSLPAWHHLAEMRRDELLRPTISIVCLVYKSTEWLQFAYEQVLRYTDLADKEFFFVANDATESVKQYLRDHYIPHHIFDNTPDHRKEWYINNVYRAWNFAAKKAKGDYILFINSDMGLTPNWVESLFKHLNGMNCVAARLVESGKMPSGEHGISKNFGRTWREYRERAFQTFAQRVRENRLVDGGLYMPLLIRREDFLKVGGYPEGNVIPGSDPLHPRIAKKGDPVESGDAVLMKKLKTVGVTHQTAYDSVAYHFQEGEMDALSKAESARDAEVIFANDYLTGVMGEKTMWNHLIDALPLATGIDKKRVGTAEPFAARAKKVIHRDYPNARVIVQNASFVDRIDPEKYTIVFLQDNLRGMGRPSEQQENNLKHAQLHVANSRLTTDAYPEYNFEIIPIGVDSILFSPKNKRAVRRELGLTAKKVGIFVGDLSPVKGWPEVKKIIEKRKDIFWIVVSKSEERYKAPNVSMYNKVDQHLLAKLYNAADFFILGSPVETLCLAAIEAAMCDVPILMHDTGIFSDLTDEERNKTGLFVGDLAKNVDRVLRTKFSPRRVMVARRLTREGMTDAWYGTLQQALQTARTIVLQEETRALLLSPGQKLRRGLVRIMTPPWKVTKNTLKAVLPKKTADTLYNFAMRMKDR